MLTNLKTFDELTQASLEALQEAGIDHQPGGIARLFLNIINQNLSEFYESLSLMHANAYVSTAMGEALDMIGIMLGCERNVNESDDDYRYRITRQVLSSASSNETAIRLAALSVEDVQDVVMKRYVLGVGSFALLVLTDDPNTQQSILEKVKEAVNEKVGYGINYVVTGPNLKPLQLSIKLILKDSINDAKSQEIKTEVRQVVRELSEKKGIADSFTMDELTQHILNVSPYIVSYTIERLMVDNQSVSHVSQHCNWNERFVVGSEPDAIIIT